MIPNLWMRIYVMIPKLSSDSVAFIYSSSASVSLSLSLLRHIDPLRSENSTQKPIELLHEIVTGGGGDDENLLIYCKPVRLYNILRIRSLFNMLEQRAKESEVVTDGEKSKSGKKGAKAPCAKPLSQYSQAYFDAPGV